jgi:hypothetical protein
VRSSAATAIFTMTSLVPPPCRILLGFARGFEARVQTLPSCCHRRERERF